MAHPDITVAEVELQVAMTLPAQITADHPEPFGP